MIRELEALCKKNKHKRIYAITRSSNKLAQQFYEAMGFQANALMGFYHDEDAYMYIKKV